MGTEIAFIPSKKLNPFSKSKIILELIERIDLRVTHLRWDNSSCKKVGWATLFCPPSRPHHGGQKSVAHPTSYKLSRLNFMADLSLSVADIYHRINNEDMLGNGNFITYAF